MLLGTAIPLLLFFSAYVWMYWLSLRDQSRGRYTQWAYLQLLLLLPVLPFSSAARKIAVVNSLGLGLGIHCFYAVTNYRLLRFLGDRVLGLGWSFWSLLVGDFIVHFGPWMLLQAALVFFDCDEALQFSSLLRWPTTMPPNLWVGVLTGLAHSTYCRLLIGHWTPLDLYDVRELFKSKSHAAQLKRVPLAWFGVFLGHCTAAAMLPAGSL